MYEDLICANEDKLKLYDGVEMLLMNVSVSSKRFAQSIRQNIGCLVKGH